MPKTQVNLRLDDALVERVDAAAGKGGRTAFIESAIEAKLSSPNPQPDTPRGPASARLPGKAPRGLTSRAAKQGIKPVER